MKKTLQIAIIFTLSVLLYKCSSKTDPVTNEKVLMEPNVDKRARESADKNPIFSFGKDSSQTTTYSFATSNVLWRATLKSLDFLPLVNADYSGGIIITDWYFNETNSQEQIKLTIRFLNNEVRSDSIEIVAHKKICSQNNSDCKIIKLDNSFSQKVKESIMTSARSIKIEEEKKKN